MVSINAGDLAYTLSERRTRHYYRAFAITHSIKAKVNEEALVFGKQAASPPRIGFLFTGQGAQWSQMGADLVKTFPMAKRVIQDLDRILQTLPVPPRWSLLRELTEVRSAKVLRQPEFSQPLVTALQLAILEVLDSWNICPHAVIGHSSGEIAAAAAAGLITRADAIKAAYYRGQAAKQVGPPAEPVGMLAVGVGVDVVEQYLQTSESKAQIACYNSPNSLTMSGTVSALEKLQTRLKDDGHFARMLFVDLAYHSDYMAETAAVYEQMMVNDDMFKKPNSTDTSGVRMFSSVTGKLMIPTECLDAAYWKRNMVSPVRFAQAASKLLHDTEAGADVIIEIGPANALSGPISQIKASFVGGRATNARYTSTLNRGANSTLAMYDAAGQLFLTGGAVNLARVNCVDRHSARVLVDLPNYAWNHETSYWHETQLSRDWRFKKFILHDLLGSKISGISWQAPVFKRLLKLADVPWLRQHGMGRDIVFPAAGYIAMAAEAAYQTAMVTQWKEQAPARYRFQLRDVRLLHALVLEEKTETRLTLALTPVKGGSTRSWYEYQVCSVQSALPVNLVHSTGLVCIETDYQDRYATAEALEPLELAKPARQWYKAMSDVGYSFGPCFQKQVRIEAIIGQRKTRSTIDMEPAPSTSCGQSHYPLHPAVMDACFQATTPALWNGDISAPPETVLVPKVIDSIIMEAGRDLPVEGMALASSYFLGFGDSDNPRNYATNVELYDPRDGALLFEMKGWKSGELEVNDLEQPGHTFTRISWSVDVEMLLAAETAAAREWLKTKTIQDIIDLVAHKKPGLSVLELNVDPNDDSTLWMQGSDKAHSIRAACSKYRFAAREPKTLVYAQKKLSSRVPTPEFHLLDKSDPAAAAVGTTFDLVIIKTTLELAVEEAAIIRSLDASVRRGGFVIASGFDEVALSRLGRTATLDGNVCICQVGKNSIDGAAPRTVTHISLIDTDPQKSHDMTNVLSTLAAKHWRVQGCSDPVNEIISTSTVIILDELFVSVMACPTEQQWETIKHLIQLRCRVLWVTTGAHLSVTDPTKAAITGLLRTIRAEQQLQLITLDVESPTGNATAAAICASLERLCEPESGMSAPTDSEFVERGGVVYISRLLPDVMTTRLQSDRLNARITETTNLHACEALVQLRCERLGNLDAVHFGEVEPEPAPLPAGMVEVEVRAAGLNYKDAVIAMGIVPGDDTALGHEASGVVMRVAPGTSGFTVGERVVVFDKGCFANRIRMTPSRVHRIPDDMCFDSAATLVGVYLPAIYSLFDKGHLCAGQRVLIHSAAGGIGIAAIQLAKYAGAEVFATVGAKEKRQFLTSVFGLRDDHIFSSRNTDFASQILAATDGQGVDLVLNSLTGDMLDESFRILADGGIMVEIGKRDILDRNNLPMAPFDRSLSFTAVDMSPQKISDALIKRLVSKLFELIDGGHVKPISPIHRFSWTDIPSALRFLRS